MIDPELAEGFQGVLEERKTIEAFMLFCESVNTIWLFAAPWAVKVPYTISEYVPRLTVTPGSIVKVTPLLIVTELLKLIGLIGTFHSVLVVIDPFTVVCA